MKKLFLHVVAVSLVFAALVSAFAQGNGGNAAAGAAGPRGRGIPGGRGLDQQATRVAKELIGVRNLNSLATQSREFGGLGLKPVGEWKPELSAINRQGGHGMDAPFMTDGKRFYLPEAKSGPRADDMKYPPRMIDGTKRSFYQGSREWADYLINLYSTGNELDKALARSIQKEYNNLYYLKVKTYPSTGPSDPEYGTYSIGKLEYGATMKFDEEGVWHITNGKPRVLEMHDESPKGLRNPKVMGTVGFAISLIGALGVAADIAQPYLSAHLNERSQLRVDTALNEFLKTQPIDQEGLVRLIIEDFSNKADEYVFGRVWAQKFEPAKADNVYWVGGKVFSPTDVKVDGWPIKKTLAQTWAGTATVEATGSRSGNAGGMKQTLAPGYVKFSTKSAAPYPYVVFQFGGRQFTGVILQPMARFVTKDDPIVLGTSDSAGAWKATLWFNWSPQAPEINGEIIASDNNKRTLNLKLAGR